MYQSGFVVVVKDQKGKVLREKIEKNCKCLSDCYCLNSSAPSVYLPFNTHYSLLLKNNHNRRAVATIYIDGTEVISNRRIIIPPNSDVEIERFCIDGDLDNGRKFYFVPKDDSRVSDPTNKENGLIEVIFRLEKEYKYKPAIIDEPQQQPIKYPEIPPQWPWGSPWDKQELPNSPWDQNNLWCSTNYNSEVKSFSIRSKCENSIGATVEGNLSNQKFTTASSIGELESSSTTIKLQLRGLVEEDKKQRISEIEKIKKQIKELEKKIKTLEY